MKLLIIRHGDPDYTIDSLTRKGWREAELLSTRISAMEVAAFYVSPLGRAKDTASLTLGKMDREAEQLLWLREFQAPILIEETNQRHVTWDWIPSEWTKEETYYNKDLWHSTPIMQEANAAKEEAFVKKGLDELLKKHGYEREGKLYRAVKPNKDTIILFCHFGVQCVMLAHLIGISPMILWHHFCAAPTSVTTLITEERRRGTAVFRMSAFGDTSHLYKGGELPSFAARFCETYDSFDERHD